jgi:hypothetical protein
MGPVLMFDVVPAPMLPMGMLFASAATEYSSSRATGLSSAGSALVLRPDFAQGRPHRIRLRRTHDSSRQHSANELLICRWRLAALNGTQAADVTLKNPPYDPQQHALAT